MSTLTAAEQLEAMINGSHSIPDEDVDLNNSVNDEETNSNDGEDHFETFLYS